MANNAATLFVCDEGINVVLASGKRVTKWAQAPLDAGLVKDGLVTNPAEVARIVKALFKTNRIRAKKVMVALSGLHCLTTTLTLPKVQQSMMDEAVKREAEIALPVPLDQLQLSWQSIPPDTEFAHIFLAAAPRNNAEALVQTVRLAGLKPQFVDLAPLALARLAGGSTGVLADIRATQVDIVVVADGLPQQIRSQTYPSQAQTVHEKLLVVKEELERSINFYDSGHPEKPLDAAAFSGRLPIRVSGKLVQDPAACQFLTGELNRNVLPLISPLKLPPGFPNMEFMVNIGLATRKVLPVEDGDQIDIAIDILPDRFKKKKFPFTRYVTTPVASAAAIALLFYLGTSVQAASHATTTLQRQLDMANTTYQAKFAKMQEQKKTLADLTKKVATLKTTYDALSSSAANLSSVVSNLDNSEKQLVAQLKTVMSTLPQGVALSKISYSVDLLTVEGLSNDQATVFVYARNLRQSALFLDVTVASIATEQPKEPSKAQSRSSFSLLMHPGRPN
ncbi:MAG: pilus assembly protein PilM [Dehalococcoidia bacterium]|nr:pilus assembly protein PilM [Dehalococcoidia bacterium]